MATIVTRTGKGAGGVGFTAPWVWHTEDGAGRSGYMTRQLTADNQAVPLLKRGDEKIICVINATGAARIFGVMPDGAMIGQEILFSVPAGSWGITFQHGTASYNMDLGGSNVVLAAAGVLRMVWNSVDWVKI